MHTKGAISRYGWSISTVTRDFPNFGFQDLGVLFQRKSRGVRGEHGWCASRCGCEQSHFERRKGEWHEDETGTECGIGTGDRPLDGGGMPGAERYGALARHGNRSAGECRFGGDGEYDERGDGALVYDYDERVGILHGVGTSAGELPCRRCSKGIQEDFADVGTAGGAVGRGGLPVIGWRGYGNARGGSRFSSDRLSGFGDRRSCGRPADHGVTVERPELHATGDTGTGRKPRDSHRFKLRNGR